MCETVWKSPLNGRRAFAGKQDREKPQMNDSHRNGMIPFQHVLHLHRMNEDMLMVTSLTQKKALVHRCCRRHRLPQRHRRSLIFKLIDKLFTHTHTVP